jgi:hypothetical protein
MGYRSDVKCAFVFTDEFVRDAFFVSSMVNAENKLRETTPGSADHIETYVAAETEWFRDSFTSCVISGNPVLLLEMDDVKWYDDFWFVKFVEEMKDECINRGGGYRLVRIGEDSEDSEIDDNSHENFDDFSGYDYLDISRHIAIQ